MHQNQEEYISLKDIILKAGSYFKYVFTKKFYIIGLAILFGLAFAAKTYLTIPMYSEQLTFMMDESQGDQLKGLNILDGLFGKSGNENSLGKILQLFESKRIIHTTLFETIEMDGKKDYLANHMLEKLTIKEMVREYKYFRRFGWKETWPEELLKDQNFKFTHPNVDNFNGKENQYLRILYEKVSGNAAIGLNPQLNSSMDEETGIMTLSMTSEHEMVTLSVLNTIYHKLSGFFIEKSTEKQAKTFRIMKEKRDSVVYALKRAEYRLADFKDGNRNLVTVKGYLDQVKLERDVTVLNTMYAEAVKQMEITDFALKNKMPVVQIIDLPRSPIYPSNDVAWKEFIIGSLLGGVLMTFLLVLRKIFKDIME
jgi:hypothetical protein